MFSVRLRFLAAATAAGLAVAGLTACAGSGSATESSTAKSNVAIVPTYTGQTADDIFPIVDGAQITPFNQQDFQNQMWLPVYTYGGDASDQFGYDSEASLASQPVYSDNDSVVTITLKHYNWSDGQPVTARDVQFYYNLYVANKSYAGYYTPGEFPDNVKSFQVTGTYSIQLTLIRSFNPTWYTTNELVDLMAFPQQTWDKTSATSPVGNYDETHAGAVKVFNYLIAQSHALNTYATNPLWQVVDGPFQLKSFSTRGDIDLVPNPHYSGSPKAKIKELIERPFTSDTTEFNSLLAGTGLAYGTIPTQDNNQVKALERLGYRAFTPDLYAINYIVLNFNSPSAGPLFRQLYIRQALQHLVNQPQDVNYAYNGDATPTYGPVPLAPSSPYATSYERANPYPFSVSTAKSLLTGHGWTIHAGGTDTCTKPGTAADECGAGISAGKALSIRVVYA
ncbi:MAG: ABC transporter substrate-binding protein, partial [Streptosporangiaceae bacterium]